MEKPQSTIAVFGSSEPGPGDALYEQARELGAALADAGYAVITGGYGGVMEAASRGAREAGGTTSGVTCGIFPDRDPNEYLDRTIRTSNLFERQHELIRRADGYVVLPGRAGTLAELSMLWALNRAGCLDQAPVVLLGDYWSPLVQGLIQGEMLEPRQVGATRFVGSSSEAIAALRTHPREDEGK